MSLNSMLAAAQGGAFYKNAGATVGLGEADAKAAISAMAPAIAEKLKAKAEADPEAFDALLDLLEEGGDSSDLDDVDAMTGAEALSDGAQILEDLYGAKGAGALSSHAPDLPAGARTKLAAISATSVLAALAASQPQQVADVPEEKSGGGFFAVIFAAIFKGLLQGASRQLAPKRRRRRSYGYSYATRRRTPRRRTRRPGLDSVFDAILKNR